MVATVPLKYITSALSAHTLHIHLCVYHTYLYTLCIASPYSLHISVYSLCTSLYTLNFVSLILFHTLRTLICVYYLTGNDAAPQIVGLLHGPHRLQPHATGNKHRCCVCVRRVRPETETPIGTFGRQCSLPAILQVLTWGEINIVICYTRSCSIHSTLRCNMPTLLFYFMCFTCTWYLVGSLYLVASPATRSRYPHSLSPPAQ